MVELKNQPEIEKWIAGRTTGTKKSYLSAMRAYMEFTKLTPKQLIDQIEEDRQKSPREQGVPEVQLNKFYDWIVHDYQQKAKGKGREIKKTNGKKGASESLAVGYCMSIRSFYRKNGFPIDGTRINIPQPIAKPKNSKYRFRRGDVRKLCNVATSLRDKAVILLQYQSFQGVSEVCSLNYGPLKKQLEDNSEFLVAEMIRKKRRVKYHLVIGSEVVGLLKLYLAQRKRDGEKLEYNTPLFIKEGRAKKSRQRITPNLIELMMRDLGVKAGLVSPKQLEEADINPCRPHALRSSGMTVAKLSGMPEVAVEYMAGHKLDRTTEAYWQTRAETELRELYRKHYNALRVLKTAVDEEKVKELETKVVKRDDVIDALIENGKVKEKKIHELEEQYAKLNQQVGSIQAFLRDLDAVNKWIIENIPIPEGGSKLTKEEVEKILKRQQETKA